LLTRDSDAPNDQRRNRCQHRHNLFELVKVNGIGGQLAEIHTWRVDSQPVRLEASARQRRSGAARRAGPERRRPAPEGGTAARHRRARHPKKSRRVLCQGVKVKYAFMKQHADEFRLAAMCRVLHVHRSGYYAWLRSPASASARDDQRLTGLIIRHRELRIAGDHHAEAQAFQPPLKGARPMDAHPNRFRMEASSQEFESLNEDRARSGCTAATRVGVLMRSVGPARRQQ